MSNLERVVRKAQSEISGIQLNIAFAQELGHLEAAGVVDWAIYDDYVAAYVAPGGSYRSVRKAMGEGWKKHNSHINTKGDVFAGFNDGLGRRLVIIIDASLAAATCEKVQVGVVEQPIYRVVCH